MSIETITPKEQALEEEARALHLKVGRLEMEVMMLRTAVRYALDDVRNPETDSCFTLAVGRELLQAIRWTNLQGAPE